MIERITFERIYSSACEQSNAINAAADKECRSKDMASFYADCITADALARHKGLERVDFKAVNQAILKRWPKGLLRIKTAAWKLAEMEWTRANRQGNPQDAEGTN